MIEIQRHSSVHDIVDDSTKSTRHHHVAYMCMIGFAVFIAIMIFAFPTGEVCTDLKDTSIQTAGGHPDDVITFDEYAPIMRPGDLILLRDSVNVNKKINRWGQWVAVSGGLFSIQWLKKWFTGATANPYQFNHVGIIVPLDRSLCPCGSKQCAYGMLECNINPNGVSLSCGKRLRYYLNRKAFSVRQQTKRNPLSGPIEEWHTKCRKDMILFVKEILKLGIGYKCISDSIPVPPTILRNVLTGIPQVEPHCDEELELSENLATLMKSNGQPIAFCSEIVIMLLQHMRLFPKCDARAFLPADFDYKEFGDFRFDHMMKMKQTHIVYGPVIKVLQTKWFCEEPSCNVDGYGTENVLLLDKWFTSQRCPQCGVSQTWESIYAVGQEIMQELPRLPMEPQVPRAKC